MKPRAFIPLVVIVCGLGLALATLEPAFGLFSRVYGVAGDARAQAAPTAPAAATASKTAVAPAPDDSSGTGATPSNTPEPLVTATATPLSHTAVTAAASPTQAPRTATALATPSRSPAPSATARASSTATSTHTPTPSPTPTVCVPGELTLTPAQQRLETGGRAVATLSVDSTAKGGGVQVALLRVSAAEGAGRLASVTIFGETWVPDGSVEGHVWKIAHPPHAPVKIDVIVETKAVGSNEDAADAKALRPADTGVELLIELFVASCGATEQVEAKAALTLVPPPKMVPVPVQPSKIEPAEPVSKTTR